MSEPQAMVKRGTSRASYSESSSPSLRAIVMSSRRYRRDCVGFDLEKEKEADAATAAKNEMGHHKNNDESSLSSSSPDKVRRPLCTVSQIPSPLSPSSSLSFSSCCSALTASTATSTSSSRVSNSSLRCSKSLRTVRSNVTTSTTKTKRRDNLSPTAASAQARRLHPRNGWGEDDEKEEKEDERCTRGDDSIVRTHGSKGGAVAVGTKLESVPMPSYQNSNIDVIRERRDEYDIEERAALDGHGASPAEKEVDKLKIEEKDGSKTSSIVEDAGRNGTGPEWTEKTKTATREEEERKKVTRAGEGTLEEEKGVPVRNEHTRRGVNANADGKRGRGRGQVGRWGRRQSKGGEAGNGEPKETEPKVVEEASTKTGTSDGKEKETDFDPQSLFEDMCSTFAEAMATLLGMGVIVKWSQARSSEKAAKKKGERDESFSAVAEAAKDVGVSSVAGTESSYVSDDEDDVAAKGRIESKTVSIGSVNRSGEVILEGVVRRKSVFALTEAEERRFLAALRRMMANEEPDVPGSMSEYYRIASYHGWPSDYCTHGQETFPAWHRAYLVEFESALRRADMQLGGDGNIGLPYWDWIVDPTFPPLVRDNFSGPLPEGLVPQGAPPGSDRITWSERNTDRRIEMNLASSDLPSQVASCLSVPEHWRHASTRWTGGFSLESPHNSVHVSCGFPMTSVPYSAFDPVFWLHHSNVDRIYQSYLEAHDDSMSEFEATQRRLQLEWGEVNRFERPLDPFLHPRTGEPFRCADTFDTVGLGYRYDSIPDVRGLLQAEGARCGDTADGARGRKRSRSFCVFSGLDSIELRRKSYLLYVFVFRTEEEASRWDPPLGRNVGDGAVVRSDDSVVESWLDHPNFAGTGAVFGGKGTECTNCRSGRKPYSVLVDITSALDRVGASRYDAAVRALAVDEVGEVHRLFGDDPSSGGVVPIPSPTIMGRPFEPSGTDLRLGSAGKEVGNLQKYLAKIGTYDSKFIDQVFGPMTEAALKRAQAFLGLVPDGVAGPLTKGRLSQTRHDFSRDACDVHDCSAWEDVSKIKYWVGVSPGYLNRTLLLEEIVGAFEAWTELVGIEFEVVEDEIDADLKVRFTSVAIEGDTYASLDGKVGELAAAGKDFIHFEESVKWMLQGDSIESGPGSFKILPAFIHQVGHVIGFEHVADERAVMHPIYAPGKAGLSSVDRQLLASRGSF